MTDKVPEKKGRDISIAGIGDVYPAGAYSNAARFMGLAVFGLLAGFAGFLDEFDLPVCVGLS